MSRQINLYHPRFLKKREWLSLTSVTVATTVMLLLLAGAGAWSVQYAAKLQAEATAAEGRLKVAKDQFDLTVKASAARKPNPQFAQEVANAEQLLQRREEIARLLESGAVGNTAGFADYLRGLARQTPEGLWLTGFSIAAGGSEMEVRGRMLNPAALPDYIRRLGNEKAFRGRSFAALTLNRPETPGAAGTAAVPVGVAATAVSPASTFAGRAIDFVLTPRRIDVSTGAVTGDETPSPKIIRESTP
jgi:hypothetical protein